MRIHHSLGCSGSKRFAALSLRSGVSMRKQLCGRPAGATSRHVSFPHKAQGRGFELGPTEVGYPRGPGEPVVQPPTFYSPRRWGRKGSWSGYVFSVSYLTHPLLTNGRIRIQRDTRRQEEMRKIRAALIAGALTAIVLAIAPAASGASAANVRCVGHPPCFATIQQAVDAVHDGDVIRIEPGTFAGGVTIDKSVKVVGSGARKTIIKGGGPVLTIGEAFAPREPKVTISKVKITGGHTTSSPLSKEFFGKKNLLALGGGIAIPPGKFTKDHITDGATVKVTDSVISGNRVGPSATVPSGLPCPSRSCPFAYAGGGGLAT